MSYSVRFYRNSRGDVPVWEFITTFNEQTRAKFFHLKDLLCDYGPRLGYPQSKHIKGELYELRIRGKNEIRIFYARFESVYILLHAFQKKSQKTPIKELRIAMERLTTI